MKIEMKSNSRNKFGKSSKQSMIRIAQISEFGFNEIFPKIFTQESENIKKFKKKKQTNIKHSNTKQNNKINKEGNTKK
ncbi:MAG: hypothetical protein HOP31_05995 [Ignavibacteria bacterium]|nr:hypothetical protein [Ignavibacteria bacterium]